MSRIIIEDKLYVKKPTVDEYVDIKNWAEVNVRTSQSHLDCTSESQPIYITSGNNKFVTAYNSKNYNALSDFESRNYLKNHVVYLGKINNENIWICQKGCSPFAKSSLYESNSSGSYKLVYNNGNIDIYKDSTVVKTLSNKQVIWVALQGAGGGGSGGQAYKHYYVVYWDSRAWSGSGGGSGATIVMALDMSILGTVNISVGAGGGAGHGKDSAGGFGGSTTLSYNNTVYATAGGGGGGKGYAGDSGQENYGLADNIKTWNFTNGGDGGTYSHTANSNLPNGMYVFAATNGITPTNSGGTGNSVSISGTDKYGNGTFSSSGSTWFTKDYKRTLGAASAFNYGAGSGGNGSYLGSINTGFDTWYYSGYAGANGAFIVYY